jgi:SnoaL-like polyketide cyclase
MTTEEMKATVNHIVTELSKGNLGVYDEVFDPQIVNYALPPGMPPTTAGTKQNMGTFLAAFPDLNYRLEDVVAADDKITYRITGRATMRVP